MYEPILHNLLQTKLQNVSLFGKEKDLDFCLRFAANITTIHSLYQQIYGNLAQSEELFGILLDTIINAYIQRSQTLKNLDKTKQSGGGQWHLSNEIVGMSLYVDRFCGSLSNLGKKLDYFDELGVNFLHLMPIMESPEGESDGGYAVSDFRKVDKRFGTIKDLRNLDDEMKSRGMYLMLDIVLNHTSHHHDWAQKASNGDKKYQDYYYMYNDRQIPDAFEKTMPDVFPDSSPGSFTFDEKSGKWVMTVFNYYQWDLNYANPEVFNDMMDTVFYYANLGVDILRIDAPAFIWKQMGTTCQNLPQAHTLLQLIKHCVQVATPGMVILGEAIVAPKEIMKYFGIDSFKGRECDVAYNATQMALQWDALATGDIRVMHKAQYDILQKPFGATWITYTRCHDDIGLGYEDDIIRQAGFNAYEHRTFLKNYYSGQFRGSVAKGALFGYNPKTNDARISGSLASLCGLEYGKENKLKAVTQESISKILLMQAQSMLIGGIPMLYYGDECGYTNDYSYLDDAGKSYDNRWMHRPIIHWTKNERRNQKDTTENQLFWGTQKLIAIRKSNEVFRDASNIIWLNTHNTHVIGFVRYIENQKMVCLFNYSPQNTGLTWYAFKEQGISQGTTMIDLWSNENYTISRDDEYLLFNAYQFIILKVG